MAIVTVNYFRYRTELKTFVNASIGTCESDYASYEASKAADTSKTWSVRVVNGFFDGTNYVIIAEGSYIERNENFFGQVPEV